MVNNSFFRKTWAVTRYVIARILRVFSWCLMYTVILPLATMVLMTLFVLWKDNTTPGQLLIQEIEFVREVAPAGQFPVRDCSAVVDGKYTEPLNQRCTVIFTDAEGYIEDTNNSLESLVLMLWSTLALVYAAMALFRKVQKAPEKITCIRVATADERLKKIFTEDTSLPEKIRKCPVYFPDARTNRNNGDKNEHA
ncbi:conjugal transfer pilus-stabilizing protein TraP [Escherichia coli]|uniref:conjugal transfer pilus-stabilizing protein TraP n=1 Tax=Escherichia coli TaxID=562 RepID=UPI000CFCA58F|nr:conjugal transfer pilus-stabilizing protein TraP [Escherichia coli]EEV9294517.1 conjugal transfer protein TraP [Escherichia coli]EEV9961993.1 conjugal transfer protein TraP [Escherichia coli]EEV9981827.1 conjugal transfer protein TraP [Escherichia coli]EEW7842713.1 conjugal transfer protein TraP [Escherichia coli]EGE7005301.1 conjugal transfer protein TraP [Escherichia coli]